MLLLALLGALAAPQDPLAPPRVAGNSGGPAVSARATAPDETLVVYDVRDLTGQGKLDALARDIVSDAVSMETRVVLLERYRELLEAGEARGAMKELITTIESLLEPGLDSGSKNIASLGDGTLTVIGSAAQHKWVDTCLTGLRTFQGNYDVKTTMYTLERGRIAELLKGRSGVVLDAAELAALHAASAASDVMMAPRVIFQPGHAATLSVLDQTAYVKDFELTIVPGRDEELVDPVVDVIETGVTLTVRAAPLSETRAALRAELTLTDAKRPFPSKTMTIGVNRSEVKVQLPEVETVRASGRFDLAFGHAIAFGAVGEAAGGGGRELLVVLELAHVPAVAPAEGR